MDDIQKLMRKILFEERALQAYVRPVQSFHTLDEWEEIVWELLDLQTRGLDTRGGTISPSKELHTIINQYFDYQLNFEVKQYEQLTKKNVLDHIEDFVNHRFWGLEREFGHYFPNISNLKFAFFFSRGDLEPYVLLDEEYTEQIYGNLYNEKTLYHVTSETGARKIQNAVNRGRTFDISAYTTMKKQFFRKESNIIIKFMGNVKAAFRSDIKSIPISNGNRACNLYRLEYPGLDTNNICYDVNGCDEVRTNLWNEYIAEPLEILGATHT